MTLALLITAVGGAWAQSSLNVVEFEVPKAWEGDVTSLTAADFPGFKDYSTLTDDEAKAIPNPDPSYNQAIILVYGFDGIETKYIVWDEEDIRVIKMSVARDAFYEETAANRKIYYTYADPNAVEVTTNAAEEGATFTEASFAMPAFDATAEYELVRDMAISMPVTVGTGNDGFRIRIKKDNQTGKFVPAEMTPQAMAGLITVTDDIEEKTLTNVTDYTVSIFAIDDQDQPTGDAIAFTDLTPGRYVAIATAAQGTIYDGQTPASNIFVLYQGYEVTIPAGEYITYYRDEPLKLDDNETNAELYTISAVGTETATLSGPYDAMKALTPMLVHNKNTEEAKTILLIPCNEPDLALTVAPEFKGTLEATEIAASSATSNNYAFNGKQFVWVKTALAVGQYKAWLEVPTGTQSAPILTLVFGDATKIENTNVPNLTNGDWYDLNGRKLQGKPTKKGVYLFNGKKVVVK